MSVHGTYDLLHLGTIDKLFNNEITPPHLQTSGSTIGVSKVCRNFEGWQAFS
jgi:hypothetical protein